MTSASQPTKSVDLTLNSSTANSPPPFDLVCVGFGGAQLATAIANREARKPSKVLFLERKSAFSWHSGPHMSRTRTEAPFMYDLATLRNPRTAFSYVNYLFTRKRLVEFANSDRLNPLREEFEDYLKWCAEHFKDEVRYGSEVVGVVPETEAGLVRGWKLAVKGEDGQTYTVRARSIVAPFPSKENTPMPQPLPTVDFLAGQRIISMDDYVSKRNDLRGAHEPRLSISVIGSGPQTAEILDDLLSCPRLGDITVVTEDESLAPLTVLGEQEPPQPQLCSIWAKPARGHKGSIKDASELVQTIYMRAYEKQVQTKGQYRLRVIIGKDAAAACSRSDFIIKDTATSPVPSSELLQSLDALVLGCRQKRESMHEVQFKQGAVAEGCQVWLVSNVEGGRSLAKDISLMAGDIVKSVSSVAADAQEGVVVQAARL
ncbi:Nn.00g043370.m01.CDS01 [Neocucurbitaria sp. VM-36]